tara:strand:+ start:6886 stop:7602 length:717 start_codon:yes stop_codon:yes gene_type:complete
MSISNSDKQKNPATKFVEWQGGDGKFYYYDKEAKEKVDMPKKFQIVGLDELATIKGYDEKASSGVYSNEVKSTTQEVLTVKNFKGDLLAKGLYQDIKGHLSGGKYTKSIYAALVNKDGSVELINLSIKGSALSPWIDAKINISGGFVITCGANPEEKKKGRTVYYEPTFDAKPLPEGDIRDTVVQLDKDVLQPYLKQYLSTPVKDDAESDTVNDAVKTHSHVMVDVEDDSDDDLGLPF